MFTNKYLLRKGREIDRQREREIEKNENKTVLDR